MDNSKKNLNILFVARKFENMAGGVERISIDLMNSMIKRGHDVALITWDKKSVSAHAEINAINQASQFIQNYRLIECDIYVTLEPCHMCAKAIVDARIDALYFGAMEPRTGAVKSIDQFLNRLDLNHKVIVSGGYMQEESSSLLRKFFKSKRNNKCS